MSPKKTKENFKDDNLLNSDEDIDGEEELDELEVEDDDEEAEELE